MPRVLKDPAERGKRKRETANKHSADASLATRDIYPLPDVVNPLRKSSCRLNFQLYCENYFPQTFELAWSADHLSVLGQIQQSSLEGGLFATAMPRGSGKTSIVEVACIWVASYGHRDFIALIGSDEGHASEMLDSIKTEFESNELLLEDFPEVVYPIHRLDGIAHRCAGQLYNGKRTYIGWTADELILPTIPGSAGSGVTIKVAGLTGGIRGMKFKRRDGHTVRPSFVVIDDPQTDQSARSRSQCETRERILSGAVLGLAGPKKKISGIMPCTVIAPGDMADAILNRDKHPEWCGTRTKLVYSFPANEKLWEEYGRLRADGLRAGDQGRAATEFYRQNREAMDAGSRVMWPERFNHDELSAIQNAMNLRLRDERAFFAEYQNEPLAEVEARSDDLTPDQVAGKLNRMQRGEVAVGCNHLTGFIDVQASMLYWLVCAWEDNFTGFIIDYGAFPDQKRPYFTLRDAKYNLASVTKGTGLEAQIYSGLEMLTTDLLSRNWPRDDGSTLRIDRCLIDANWGVSTSIVKRFCRQSPHSTALTPSHGRHVGAAGMPMSEWPRRDGEKAGHNWRLRAMQDEKRVRAVIFDTNFWKSFVHSRLATAMGDPGCLSLYGDKADAHRLLADHLTAEYRVRTEGRGRTVDEWKIRPEQPDNHWLDCLVGSAVAASMLGISLPESSGGTPGPKPRKRLTMAEMRAGKKVG